MQATLVNSSVTIAGYGITLSANYPERFLAATAYEFVWECCERFNKEPSFNPEDEPRIYVYGVVMTPFQFMKKFAGYAERAGAIIRLQSDKKAEYLEAIA